MTQVHLRGGNAPSPPGVRLIACLESEARGVSRSAGVLTMEAKGLISHDSPTTLVSRALVSDHEIKPIAFLTFATSCSGRLVSAWRVPQTVDATQGSEQWQLIASRDTRLPQGFYPLPDPQLTLIRGDTIAVSCVMQDACSDSAERICRFSLLFSKGAAAAGNSSIRGRE